MAFLWGASPAQAEFDTLLEKTTSDLLPSSTPVDLTLSLELADFIRSGSIQPPQSCKSLLKRLQHSNPNVQLLSLQVLDVCIKNGGTPFLLQISDKDKDFYNGLELLAKGDSKFGGNRDVKEKTLEKLQEWAVAFKGKESLRETQLVKVYERLKNQGEPFPKIDSNASAAMVDSLSAPEWQDSSYCTRCRTDFSTFNRKHHCRNCGQVFDASCSSQTSPLPHYGITQQVRVCDGCHKKIKEGKGSQVARNQSIKSNGSSSTTTTKKKSSSSSSSSRRDQEEEDLKKAIEASLEESSHSHGPLRNDVPPTKSSGYNPSYASTTSTTTNGVGRGGGDQEDEDLAAAIAASLRDVAPPPTAPSFNRQDSSSQQAVTYSEMFPRRPSYDSYSSTTTNYDTSSSTPRPRINLPSYDLSPSQLSSISQFTSTFSQQQRPGPSNYLTNQEHELANSTVRDLQPRLERSLEDTRRRIEILKELEWKLSQAARLYGAGLTELNNNNRQVYQPITTTSRREEPYHHQQQYVPSAVNPQYQYHPSLSSSSFVGQPLPNYSLPSPQQPQHYQNQQQEHEPLRSSSEEPTKRVVPVAAGYYKPSSFPSVPHTNPISSLESLPHVPEQEPWRQQQQQQEEEEEEEERRKRREEEETKIGELIEF